MSGNLLLERGEACYQKGEYSRAVELLEEALQQNPGNPRPHNVLGNVHWALGNLEKALAEYSLAADLDKEHKAYAGWPGTIHNNRAGVLVLLQRHEEALAAVEEAMRIEPANPVYFCRKGVILVEHLKDNDEALKCFKKAIDLDPDCYRSSGDGSYYYYAALCLARQGKYEGASIFVKKAFAFTPDDARYHQLQKEIAASAGPSLEPSLFAPRYTFADLGGMRQLKEEIKKTMNIVLLEKEKARKYGIEKNGILLYGPAGCGKSFVAEAIAGEFKLSFVRAGLASVYPGWIEKTFEDALLQLPCLLFFDEFESIAAQRGKVAHFFEEQKLVNAFLQEFDNYRRFPGLVIAAATNNPDALDKAATREGRFDYKIKIQKPDFDARMEILQVKLKGRPVTEDIEYASLATKTEGFSTAKLARVVNEAAIAALEEDRRISNRHLSKALEAEAAQNKFEGKKKTWDDLILNEKTKRELQVIGRLIENPDQAKGMGVDSPSGVLLYGPPGTGKTTIGRVLASQLNASFYLVTPADVYSKWLGESEEKVREIFEKARANKPSIIFLDEIDALLTERSDGGSGSHWANTIVSLFLMEMDGLNSEPGVLVIGATNRHDLLDEALLRPGRLSEKIEIPLPSEKEREALFKLFTKKMKLDDAVRFDALAKDTDGSTGADIEDVCNHAGRSAFMRVVERGGEPVVSHSDFEHSLVERKEAARSMATKGPTAGFMSTPKKGLV
jgi:transitional endoplasmic reticulum ATPase